MVRNFHDSRISLSENYSIQLEAIQQELCIILNVFLAVRKDGTPSTHAKYIYMSILWDMYLFYNLHSKMNP